MKLIPEVSKNQQEPIIVSMTIRDYIPKPFSSYYVTPRPKTQDSKFSTTLHVPGTGCVVDFEPIMVPLKGFVQAFFSRGFLVPLKVHSRVPLVVILKDSFRVPWVPLKVPLRCLF